MNPFHKMISAMFGGAKKEYMRDFENKPSIELQVAFDRVKIQELEHELALQKEKYDKLKAEADRVANRLAAVEEEHRDIMINSLVTQIKSLNPKDDKIVAVVVRNKTLVENVNFARINHVLRHAAPWLDLVFMIHENVELKSMNDGDLFTIGLQRVPPKKDEEEKKDGDDKANLG